MLDTGKRRSDDLFDFNIIQNDPAPIELVENVYVSSSEDELRKEKK